jgi:CheY-like chemotaxis protein
VDDEDLLNLLGYKTLIARSGKETVEIFEEKVKQISMAILDMIMPDISGGEVYDRLKKINPKVKILLSSGYSTDGRVNEISDRGCNGFIQKPYNMKALSQKMREILDEK